MTRTDWPARWMARARVLATWSKDPSTKVGCVLVRERHAIAEGYNGFPHGADDTYGDRALKLERTVHAEANAIAHAARFGHETLGAMAFVSFPPCPPCAGLLIQAGIVAVYVLLPRCEYCESRERDLGDKGTVEPRDEEIWTRIGPRFQVSGDPTYRHNISRRSEVLCGLPSHPEWLARYETTKVLLTEAGVPLIEHTR